MRDDTQRLQAAWSVVDQLRQQARAKRKQRDAFRFIATGIGAVAIWLVFANWIL